MSPGRRVGRARQLAVLLAISAFAAPGVVAGPSLDPTVMVIGNELRGAPFQLVQPPTPCPEGVRLATFDVVAKRLPIAYNRWGDNDPEGRIFLLAGQDVDTLEEILAPTVSYPSSLGRRASDGEGEFRDFIEEPGLRFGADPEGFSASFERGPSRDFVGGILGAIIPPVGYFAEPFIVRAHVGDCVEFRLTNELPEHASIHVHNVISLPGEGMALGLDRDDVTPPGRTRTYRFQIPDDPAMEGAHFLHSHGDSRYQTRHGLFGALVVEPKGAEWRKPDGSPSFSGAEAQIVRPNASDFREHVLIYHDEVELLDSGYQNITIVDAELSGAYGPGRKAINLRTEPFMDRFRLHEELYEDGALARGLDKSQAYGSYTYGDPSTPIPKGYVGDPTKFRLVNAGPGQHHTHHLHGGGVRWRVSPLSEDTQFADGLVKHNPVVRAKSERVDVVNMGPGESYNAEIEGGAGGVQQAVGDFLFHCHIAEHYVAGMWSFWRVYNTLQPGLAELPDREGRVSAAVTSLGLVGVTLRDGSVLTNDSVRPWVAALLPPRGVPVDDDASVWDWSIVETSEGPRFVGEPETAFAWANYQSPTPAARPDILFDPRDGRLAYPLLRPHLGERPPFAPSHGPAPYLTPDVDGAHPDGLCPPREEGGRSLRHNIVALQTPVPYWDGGTDAAGQVFALAEDVAEIRRDPTAARNLVLRANQGDCVDVVFTSALQDTEENHRHSKVSMHIHMVQFDPQGSDGAIAGLAYEQSVRPMSEHATLGTALQSSGGATLFGVTSVEPFFDAAGEPKIGTLVGVNLGAPSMGQGRLMFVDAEAKRIILEGVFPLTEKQGRTVRLGYEFVNYRWYPDVELGTVYFHDHVDGIRAWRHGLFGALVVEPKGSRWLDPMREIADPAQNLDLRSGTMADIVTPEGSYREFVVEFQDRAACLTLTPTTTDRCDMADPFVPPSRTREPAGFNLRAEPLAFRHAEFPFSSHPIFGSASQGDPATDVWRAHAGDPVVVRLLYGGQSMTTGVGTFSIEGHRFPVEQWNAGSRLVDALSLGIANQWNLRLECGAGGCGQMPGDYLYQMTQPDLVDRGAWGVFRVIDPGVSQSPLQPLWGFAKGAPVPVPHPAMPDRTYDIVAFERPGTPAPPPPPPPRLVWVNATTELTWDPAVINVAVGGSVEFWAEDYEDHIVRADDGSWESPIVSYSTPPWRRAFPVPGTYPYHCPIHGSEMSGTIVVGVQALPDLPPTHPQKMFKLAGDPSTHPKPFVIRARVGEVVELRLTNELDERASLHPTMVRPVGGVRSLGIPVGFNNPSYTLAPPGGTASYTIFADREGISHIRSYAWVGEGSSFEPHADHASQGLFGALIIEPAGSTWTHATGAASDIRTGGVTRTEHVLLYASNDRVWQASVMPYTQDVQGPLSINFANASLAARLGAPLTDHPCTFDAHNCSSLPPEHRNPANAFAYSAVPGGDVATPIVHVPRGRELLLRVVGGAGDQLFVHTVHGHSWKRDAAMVGSNVVDADTVGAGESFTSRFVAGPGGEGDYYYGAHRDAFAEAGAWGVIRVGPRVHVQSFCAHDVCSSYFGFGPRCVDLGQVSPGSGACAGKRTARITVGVASLDPVCADGVLCVEGMGQTCLAIVCRDERGTLP